jgi:hypothetical protein
MMKPTNATERIAARYIPGGYSVYRESPGGIVYAQADHLGAIAYRGTATNPEWHYRFRNAVMFDEHVAGFFAKIEANQKWQAEKKEARTNFEVKIKVGDILDTCWGYDQTNVEFFQVVHVSGKTATVREIAQHETDQTGPFSSRVEAVRDQFLKDSKEHRCRILSPGDCMKIEGHWASLWTGSPVHSSWGA